MIAGRPVAHKEGHYRCSLPGLAGFMNRCCTGPGYQTGNIQEKPDRKTAANKLPAHFLKWRKFYTHSSLFRQEEFQISCSGHSWSL